MTDETLVVALGERRYRVEHDWARLPAGDGFGPVSQVAADSRGRVYVFQRHDPPVLVFAPDGSFLGPLLDGRVADAHGIYIDPADRLFLVDRDAHQVHVCTTDGREIMRLGERHAPRFGQPFNHPTDAAVGPDGCIYVADGYANACVHRFDPDGRFEHSFGEPGTAPGAFRTPHAVWVDADQRVIVADRDNDRLQVFDRDGDPLAVWSDFVRPMDVWLDGGGRVYVSDQAPRVALLERDGRLVGRCRPVWNGAHGLFGDAAGNLFLAEMNPARITRLAPIADG